ncbi:hypothetical protein [Picosynechococcus sp. PCC 8807]|uniref:hypothetical protein n=1 Tax=Picosynechococcus sp. PCC 8807 TaxID=195248 RepID=UPI000810783B|nr:hypothetical protein [Picosynechococcus sp. PCC 8807]ANV90842.1 hypothetical protein AWQ24_09475 [Picosynechococcus sp. PCC 8807]
MLHDFQLSILALGHDQYQLRLSSAIAPGAEPIMAVVTWQPEAWLATWANYPLETWGKMLFTALFTGEIYEHWQDMVAIAKVDNLPIHVYLGLPDGILWFLPWEAMFIEPQNYTVHFSRQRDRAIGADNSENLDTAVDLSWLGETEPEEDVAFIQDIFANMPEPSETETDTENDHRGMLLIPSWRSLLAFPRSLLGLGLIIMLTLGGILLGRHLQNLSVTQTTTEGIMRLTEKELEKLADADLVQLAQADIDQDNWGNAEMILAELLDRQAFGMVQPLLFDPAIAPENETIAFLRGRYIWQTTLAAVPPSPTQATAIATVQDNWDIALAQQPNDPEILMALGFVHYLNADYEAANDRWYEALAAATTQDFPPVLQAEIYAGLAISMYDLAQGQPTDVDQEILVGKAEKLRAIALDLDRSQLNPRRLEQSWLWFPEAIATWQTLLALEESP